jgi:nucleotide-binding universal stress UspA family protein
MTTSRYHRLLVPLDGSPLAEKGIPAAAALARRGGGVLHLASVLLPTPRYPHTTAEIGQALEREARDRVEGYLAAQAEALSTCYGLEAIRAVLKDSPAEALADYARTNAIDLVVMTTHGRSGLGRFWLGSVADRLLRCTATPTLLIRSREEPQHTDFRRVLVALDGSPEDEAVLEAALALASLYHEPCCSLVQVIEPPFAICTDMSVYPEQVDATVIEQQEALARSNLERLAERPRALGIAATAHLPVSPAVGAQILELARKLDSDLIAVGSHGRHGAQRLLLGSVADKVVRGAPTPVLVVPVRAPCVSRGRLPT